MIDAIVFKLIGALGLICITLGVIFKKKQDYYYIAGGIFLEIYSIYIKDTIFIVLQLVFLVAVFYDLFLRKKQKK